VRSGGTSLVCGPHATVSCNPRRSAGVELGVGECSEGVEREIAVLNNPEDEPERFVCEYINIYLYSTACVYT